MKRFEVELYFSTVATVTVEAESPEEALKKAGEQTEDEAWWKEHGDELMANLEPWEEADIAEESEEAP